MKEYNFPYYYKGDIRRLAESVSTDLCVILPNILFDDSRFMDIPAESKLLYGHMLSNCITGKGRIDYANRYYIKMPLKNIEELFSCCHTSASKYLSTLTDHGFIEKVSLGRGRGTNIYVKNALAVPRPASGSFNGLRLLDSRQNEPLRNVADERYSGNGYSGNGYSGNGYSGNGYPGNGYSGNGHSGNSFEGSAYCEG